jgi:hypothetical protein
MLVGGEFLSKVPEIFTEQEILGPHGAQSLNLLGSAQSADINGNKPLVNESLDYSMDLNVTGGSNALVGDAVVTRHDVKELVDELVSAGSRIRYNFESGSMVGKPPHPRTRMEAWRD